MQYFGFDRSVDDATEIEFQVRYRVLVQSDHRCPAAGQLPQSYQLADRISTVIGIGECEEQLAHGVSKRSPGVRLGERREVSPIARQLVILDARRPIKLDGFNNQSWPLGCRGRGKVVQRVDRDRLFD